MYGGEVSTSRESPLSLVGLVTLYSEKGLFEITVRTLLWIVVSIQCPLYLLSRSPPSMSTPNKMINQFITPGVSRTWIATDTKIVSEERVSTRWLFGTVRMATIHMK